MVSTVLGGQNDVASELPITGTVRGPQLKLGLGSVVVCLVDLA